MKMICAPCSTAGDTVTLTREGARDVAYVIYEGESLLVDMKSVVETVARTLHTLCSGRTHCDCQHHVDFEGNKHRG